MQLIDKKHFSLDIETLSLWPNAFILSIGCVQFDIRTGEILKEFHQIIDKNSTFNDDMSPSLWKVNHEFRFEYSNTFHVEQSVIDWWKKTNPEYFYNLLNSREALPITTVLNNLENFIDFSVNDKYIWTVGDLDSSAIKNAYCSIFETNPFENIHRCWKELRTYEIALEGIMTRDDVGEAKEELRHDALYDATLQSKQITAFFNMLEKIKKEYILAHEYNFGDY